MLITSNKLSDLKSKIQLYQDLIKFEQEQTSSAPFDVNIYTMYNYFKTSKDYQDFKNDLDLIQKRITEQQLVNIWKETDSDIKKNPLSMYRVYYPVEIRSFYSIRK